MELLPSNIKQTLAEWSFTQEFVKYEQEYLDLVSRISQTFLKTCREAKVSVELTSKDDYAEQHLIDKTVIWLLSANAFTYFREALHQDLRQYIMPNDYQGWAEMMARYVLKQAILKGRI
jgi:hypothetical protein